jgi:hypothetical protein
MGSSFTEFAGFGFWSRDSQIEVWLCLLVRQIDTERDPADWKLEVRQDFVIRATAGMNGCISPDLDRLINTSERRQWLISLSRDALRELEKFGDKVPTDWLQALFRMNGSEGEPVIFFQPVEASYFQDCGNKWISLLEGTPTVKSDPLWDDIVPSDYSWYKPPPTNSH